MNCHEFRRELLTDPSSREKAFVDHAKACAECAQEAERALRFEEKLRAALDVTSSADDQAPLPISQPTPRNRGAYPSHFPWFAMATGLILALGVGGWLGYHWKEPLIGQSGLRLAVVNHINDELDHLFQDQDIPSGELALLLKRFGAGIREDIGPVNFLSRCAIRKQSGVHLVISGQRGPVTVLIMPGEYLRQREQIRSSSFAGVIVPTAYGSLAVVGYKSEPVEEIVTQIQQALVWGA